MKHITDEIDKAIAELLVSTKNNAKQIAKKTLLKVLADSPPKSSKKKKHKLI
jgi:hypothetical protein